jgi:hypothetical protein
MGRQTRRPITQYYQWYTRYIAYHLRSIGNPLQTIRTSPMVVRQGCGSTQTAKTSSSSGGYILVAWKVESEDKFKTSSQRLWEREVYPSSCSFHSTSNQIYYTFKV